jgi:hypothetical protein
VNGVSFGGVFVVPVHTRHGVGIGLSGLRFLRPGSLRRLRFVSRDSGQQDTDQKKRAEQSSGFSDEMNGGVARGHKVSP